MIRANAESVRTHLQRQVDLMGNTGVVLVVDDNTPNVAIYEHVVGEVGGVTAKCCTDPLEALMWLESELPILVVVDYRMPSMDGIAFIARMRSIPERNRIPVVMLTGSDDPQVRGKALQLGVLEFMKKPVNKKRLQELITLSLRNRLTAGNVNQPSKSPK